MAAKKKPVRRDREIAKGRDATLSSRKAAKGGGINKVGAGSSATTARKPPKTTAVDFAGGRGGYSVRHTKKSGTHTVEYKKTGQRTKKYQGGQAGADAAFVEFVADAKS